MKILAAVDGSPYTRRMLAYLAAHDEWMGPQHEYTMLTVVSPVPPRAAAVLDKATLKGYYEDSAEKIFKPLRTFAAKQGLKSSCVMKVGHAAETIAEMAKKGGYDLIVLGSHGHGTLSNLVMGSVATKVLANCTTPALLIR
ncbi:universal stress protein [Rubrivivax rivuli]|uniref:Universal stress protein n=1 Tax=Rubrivivax rivuli TaxID=1862385 RepID=A0A437RS11_9BURK|nr:universal stress protein [Rubrivivax rivuli]RVU49531.1 universal stress protein [Rubrivivax rivuli]